MKLVDHSSLPDLNRPDVIRKARKEKEIVKAKRSFSSQARRAVGIGLIGGAALVGGAKVAIDVRNMNLTSQAAAEKQKYAQFPTWEDFRSDFKMNHGEDIWELHQQYEAEKQKIMRLHQDRERVSKERDLQVSLLNEYETLERKVKQGDGGEAEKVRMKQIARRTKNYMDVSGMELAIVGEIEQEKNQLAYLKPFEQQCQDAIQHYTDEGDTHIREKLQGTHKPVSAHPKLKFDEKGNEWHQQANQIRKNVMTVLHRKFSHPQKRNTTRG